MGDELFDRVATYAGFGDHRTGTEVDHVTATWFADSLTDLGLTCELRKVPFEQWTASSRLTVDGTDVGHLPVFYEWTGRLATGRVDVQSFDPMSGGLPWVVDEPIAAARGGQADAVVLATEHPNGSLVAVNRVLGSVGSGFPTVLVAGRELERLQAGRVGLDLRAMVKPGATTNVIARNRVPGDPLLLTTPLNGWFSCAGERGTGIAVLLELVASLSDLPLLIVATGGHELGYFGAHRWVDDRLITPAAIAHLGASLAVEDIAEGGSRKLSATRVARTSLGSEIAGPMVDALTAADLDLSTDATGWFGEGEAWSRMAVPLLSLTGAGIDFHTPEDTAARATSAGSLRQVADAMAAAVRALHDLVRR